MTRIEARLRDSTTQPQFGLSVIVHVVLFSAVFLKAVFFPTESIIYQSAIRVDIVGMPEKSRALPDRSGKKNEAKPGKKKKSKSKGKKLVLRKTKKSRQDVLKRFEALHQIEKIQKVTTRPTKAKVGGVVKGNRISPGTALKGLNKMGYDTYIGELDEHVKKYWLLPEWLADANLKTQALILIDERGYVVRKMITTSSGNPTYDNLVIDAIDKASPFPAPPDKFVNLVGIDGIVFGFPE